VIEAVKTAVAATPTLGTANGARWRTLPASRRAGQQEGRQPEHHERETQHDGAARPESEQRHLSALLVGAPIAPDLERGASSALCRHDVPDGEHPKAIHLGQDVTREESRDVRR